MCICGCVYVVVRVCAHACARRIYIHTHAYIYECTRTHTRVYSCMWIYTSNSVRTFICFHFLSNTNLSICLHRVKMFQELLYNGNNVKSVICFHTTKWLQVKLLNTNYSILKLASHLLKVKWFNVLLCITINSIKYQSFVYTEFNEQTVLFLAIQSSISNLFALSQTVLFDP